VRDSAPPIQDPRSEIEEESVSSGIQDIPKKFCRGLTKAGKPCRAYPLNGGDLCLFHEADTVTNFHEAQVRGGKARRPLLDLDAFPIDLHHRLHIQAVSEGVLRLQLSGAISARLGAQILRNLALAERNLTGMSRDRVYTKELDNCSGYSAAIETVTQAMPEMIDSFEAQELSDRVRQIEDVGSRRQEYLKANQQFGHNQPRPTHSLSPASQRFRMPAFHG